MLWAGTQDWIHGPAHGISPNRCLTLLVVGSVGDTREGSLTEFGSERLLVSLLRHYVPPRSIQSGVLDHEYS